MKDIIAPLKNRIFQKMKLIKEKTEKKLFLIIIVLSRRS
jgi:hypothetical protein